MSSGYVPIACGLHDQYLAWATQRTPVAVVHADENGNQVHSTGVIADVRTVADGSEWMELADGTLIRLDRIRQASAR
jgi:hypothetical protein